MHHSKLHNYLKASNLEGWNHEVAQKMDSILKDKTWNLVDFHWARSMMGLQNKANT